MVPQQTGVAFSVDADSFMSFARSLPCGIDSPRGEPLVLTDLVDFDLCWAFDLVDPWGNQYELNCYDYDRGPEPSWWRPTASSPSATGRAELYQARR